MAISNDSKKAIKWEIEKLSQLKKKISAKRKDLKAKVDVLGSRITSIDLALTKLENDLNG